jgi:hypothetical protein
LAYAWEIQAIEGVGRATAERDEARERWKADLETLKQAQNLIDTLNNKLCSDRLGRIRGV